METSGSQPVPATSPESNRFFVEVSTSLLRAGYGIHFTATGRSMSPAIRDGEKIGVEPVDPVDIECGEIILYRSRTGVMAHRIVSIDTTARNQQAFVLRGDATEYCDDPVHSCQILGRVVWVEREGRRVMLGDRRARLLRTLRAYRATCRKWLSTLAGHAQEA